MKGWHDAAAELAATRAQVAMLRGVALQLLDGLERGSLNALYGPARDALYATTDATTWLAAHDAAVRAAYLDEMQDNAAAVTEGKTLEECHAERDARVRAAALEEAAASLVPKPGAKLASRVLVAFCQGQIRSLVASPAPAKVHLRKGSSSDVGNLAACGAPDGVVTIYPSDVTCPDCAPAKCATCGGEKFVRNTHLPRLDDPEWWPCPDCGGKAGT